MKRIAAITILMFSAACGFAQKSSAPAPQLSTADRIALQSCEKDKQGAQKQWQEALQQEQEILKEFGTNHPGFHVNSQTFSVEADQVKADVKSAVKEKK